MSNIILSIALAVCCSFGAASDSYNVHVCLPSNKSIIEVMDEEVERLYPPQRKRDSKGRFCK